MLEPMSFNDVILGFVIEEKPERVCVVVVGVIVNIVDIVDVILLNCSVGLSTYALLGIVKACKSKCLLERPIIGFGFNDFVGCSLAINFTFSNL